MLSNYIIGSYKFVLFIDDVGIERNGVKIVEKLLEENNVKFTDNEICKINEKSSVMISPFSKLSLKYADDEIFRMIQSLKRNDNVNQIFGWATSKNISSSILIPFLDHMSDVTVTIKSSYLTILTKKKFGNVKLKEYHHELQLGKTSLREVTLKTMPKEVTKINDPEIIGTFKIGQFKNDELEAKKNLKLPFEIIDLSSNSKESQITYTPESVDDFDEEDDPDNDLQF